MNSTKIRIASENDSAALLEIYGAFIKDTAVTFETEVPTVAAFGQRIEQVLQQFPWLVCEINGKAVGYAYASKHRERAAYQWSAELSVYVHPTYHRRHIATALYTALIGLLKSQGYFSAYAGITVPNAASEAFHSAFGFREIGIFEHVGYKLGAWRDVKWFRLALADYPTEPAPPIPLFNALSAKKIEESFSACMEGADFVTEYSIGRD